jgi:hypothetical protein
MIKIELYHGSTERHLTTIDWPKGLPIPDKGEDILYEDYIFRVDGKVFDYKTSSIRLYQAARVDSY